MAHSKPRLTVTDWLNTGFGALTEAGPEALKAEPLARALGTTKGSFYWHFKDVTEFKASLLGHWQAAAEAALRRAEISLATPTQRLHRLADLTRPDGGVDAITAAEPAIRAWGQTDSTAANAVAAIDRARLAYIGAVLAAIGLPNPEFPLLLYGAHLGMQALRCPDSARDGALSTLTAALLALQSA